MFVISFCQEVEGRGLGAKPAAPRPAAAAAAVPKHEPSQTTR